MNNENFQRELINELMQGRKADRRWRNIRFFIIVAMFLLYALLIAAATDPGASAFAKKPHDPYVALIHLNGEIMPGSTFSADRVVPVLNAAFKDKDARGVVLDINSPGGSPVQAAIIHDKILELKHEHPNKKVIVMGEDSLASGAYMVAVAADKIYVHNDTVTGSIGVVMSGFGFEDAIKKVGVTRRVFTAGSNKARLDSFEALRPQDVKKVHHLLGEVHTNFIDIVKAGRHEHLKGDQKELFSGDFWTGQRAVKLGLADGTGNLWDVMKKEYGVKHYRDYSLRPSFMQHLMSGVGTELHFALSNNLTPVRTELFSS